MNDLAELALALSYSGVALIFTIVAMLLVLIVTIPYFIGLCMLFKKHLGLEWWKALIPFYNTWLIADKALGSGLFMLPLFLPYVGVLWAVFLTYKLVMQLNQSVGMFALNIVVPFVGIFVLVNSENTKYLGADDSLLLLIKEKVNKK